jgi:hypothetical protein
MTPSIEAPKTEQSEQSSVVASTLNEDVEKSLNDRLKHLSVLCWDSRSKSLTIGDPMQKLSEKDMYSTLVFPANTETSARPTGVIALDMSAPPSANGDALAVTLDGEEFVLLPAPQRDGKFLDDREKLEKEVKEETHITGPEFCLFNRFDDHQSDWSGSLTRTAVADIGTAWKSVKDCLPEWPEKDPDFALWGQTRYLAPEVIAARQLAMIATLGIMVVLDDHPFPKDATLAQGLGALANAIEAGRYHKRLSLEGYAETVRRIAAGGVPGDVL